MRPQRDKVMYVVASIVSILFLIFTLNFPIHLWAESFAGVTGSSSQWGSGWMLFAPAVDFKKGDKLRIIIGGTAKKVVVRLLPKGRSPDTSVGVIGGPVIVPSTRVVEVTLSEDRKQVVQISVHGGVNPWNEFNLGGDNGSATIVSIERTVP